MKTKYFILAALAGLTFVGCTSDDFIAEAPPVNVNEGEAPIVFTSNQKAFTRADFKGADAASKLGNKFVVYGYKGGQTKWNTEFTGVNAIKNNKTVFDNYLVQYAENTAHTTESNTNNWEYVGKGVIKHATDNGITQQTIKYWDYSVSQYDFIAWSTGSKTAIYSGTPTTGQVLVSEIAATAATSTSTPATTGLTKAYTFEGEAEDLKECYIADLVTVYKGSAGGTYNVVSNGYQKPVTLKFRQLGTKVRIGIYETVPGYSVKDVKFYSEAANALLDEATTGNKEKNESAKIFTTVANGIYKEGTYTVYFPTVDAPTNADNNQAHIDFAPKSGADQKTTIDWGKLDYTIRESGESSKEPIYLGRTSNTASFANKNKAEQNYYEVFLPNEAGTNLNLRVNYTLESIDGSQETIEVKGATAQVPSIYTTWKPGYAYTYLFKISDKTNGHTGTYNPLYPDDVTINSDPAGLYPITFDAVVVNAEEDKTQETITTVSTPSITTYQKGSEVVNQNEYKSGSDYPIFVTVNDGGTTYEEVTLETGNSVAGYYTKAEVYTQCETGAKAESGVTYYQQDGDNYTAVTGLTPGSSSVAEYYTKKDVYTSATGSAIANTTYYRMTTIVENGKVVTLQNSGDGMAALYTLPSGKTYTEADVIDAMQMQDDDAAANTVKGRSGLVLTKATSANPGLVTSIQYGVNGNEIDLTAIPSGSSTYTANALKFTPAAGTSYAFVYTKKAPVTANDKELFEVKTFAVGANVNGYYRYKYKNATCTNDKGTPGEDDDIYDAQKGHVYFSRSGSGTPESPYVYAKVAAPFIGQDVSNVYTKDADNYVIASGYAVTGTEYWYTTNNGISYTKAHNEAYADFATDVSGHNIYTYDGTNYAEATGITTPAANTAYYYKDTDNKYYWCIFLPQQTKDWYELDETDKDACGQTETAIDGQTYFDKYIKNNGVYYVKVIKVQ